MDNNKEIQLLQAEISRINLEIKKLKGEHQDFKPLIQPKTLARWTYGIKGFLYILVSLFLFYEFNSKGTEANVFDIERLTYALIIVSFIEAITNGFYALNGRNIEG